MKDYNAHRHSDRFIKICGMKDAENIRQVARLMPMLMGFIFWRRSPRYAGGLDPEVVRSLPEAISAVGVFVDAQVEEILETCGKYGIGIVQLHGSESPEVCAKLKSHGFKVLKAFGIHPDFDWERVRPYEDVTDMFVFDTHCDSRGGSGKKYDWNILADYPLSTPYLLSGGIGPDDSGAVIGALRPKMAGVDINSRFESEPGIKDTDKLIHFIFSLRRHNEEESFANPFRS